MADNRVPLLDQPVSPDEASFNNIKPDVSLLDSMAASTSLSFMSSPIYDATAMIMKKQQESQLQEPTMQPSELNHQYPGMSFKDPTTKSSAALMYEMRLHEQNLQETIDAGPQGSFYGLARFGAQLLPQAIDPINYLAGSGVAKVAGKALIGTGIGRALGYGVESPGVLQNLGRSSLEGVAGNLAVEPLQALKASQFNEDYNVSDAAVNAIGAGVGFAGVHAVLGPVGRFLGKLTREHLGVIEKSAISSVANDRVPMVDEQLKDYVKETQGGVYMKGELSRAGYVFKPMDPANTGDRPMYSATHEQATSFENGAAKIDTSIIGHEGYGPGIYMTDNPHVANGEAARKIHENDGTVFEHRIADKKLLNLDEPMPDSMPLEGFGEYEGKTVKETFTNVKDAIEEGRLPESALQDLNKHIQDAGYDGIHYKETSVIGEAHDPHNVVMLYDKTGVEADNVYHADNSKVPHISPEDLNILKEKVKSPESHIFYDPKAVEAYNEARDYQDPKQSQRISSLNKDVTETQAELKQLAELPHTDAADIKEIESINEAMSMRDNLEAMIRRAIGCMNA